jgi:hypothetical protein
MRDDRRCLRAAAREENREWTRMNANRRQISQSGCQKIILA